jgi:hypothetical protein
MPADQPRTRTVGCKTTDSEYERLAAVAEDDGQTLGEWVREVLLERVDGRKPSVIEETVLGEVLALRTILLNLPGAPALADERLSAPGDAWSRNASANLLVFVPNALTGPGGWPGLGVGICGCPALRRGKGGAVDVIASD